jgi:cell division protein FtsZ
MPGTRFRFSGTAGDQPLRVKLFGLGGAGCNMIEGVPFPTVAFSTSSAALARSHADRKMQIGPERLVGVSNTQHHILKHLPSIAGHEVVDVLNNTDMAFLFCGLGGISGSLGAKLFSSVAEAKGTVDVVLATTPFSAESIRRRELAAKILKELLTSTTLCIEFDNDKLSSLSPNLPISRAFSLLNGIMLRPVMDLTSVMSRLDVGVLKQALGDSNYGRFGLGLGRGDERVERAVDEAFGSPWFDSPLSEVRAVVAVYSSSDPWDKEQEKILAMLEGRMPSAQIVSGSYQDSSLNDRIRLSLLLCRKKS